MSKPTAPKEKAKYPAAYPWKIDSPRAWKLGPRTRMGQTGHESARVMHHGVTYDLSLRWNSVERCLPEQCGYYLVRFISNCAYADLYYFDGSSWLYREGDYSCIPKSIQAIKSRCLYQWAGIVETIIGRKLVAEIDDPEPPSDSHMAAERSRNRKHVAHVIRCLIDITTAQSALFTNVISTYEPETVAKLRDVVDELDRAAIVVRLSSRAPRTPRTGKKAARLRAQDNE